MYMMGGIRLVKRKMKELMKWIYKKKDMVFFSRIEIVIWFRCGWYKGSIKDNKFDFVLKYCWKKKDLKIVRGSCTVLPGTKTIEEQHLGRSCPSGGACIQRATKKVPPSHMGDSCWIQTSQIHTIFSQSRCSRHQGLVSGIFFLL